MNGDNLEYDEDGTLASKENTGYMPYASENLMQLCFRAENGYIITKITLDDVTHDIIDSSEQGAEFVKKAVEQGYVAVDRKTDHTIIIETKKWILQFQRRMTESRKFLIKKMES